MAKESTTKYEVTLLSTPASGAKKTMWRAGRQFEVKVTQVLELTKEEVEVFKNDKRFKLSKATKASSEPKSSEKTSGSESDAQGGDETSTDNDSSEDQGSEDSSSDDTEEDSDEDTTTESRLDVLLKESRKDLDALATSLGVEAPEKLENKTEVAQAIVEAEASNSESEATS